MPPHSQRTCQEGAHHTGRQGARFFRTGSGQQTSSSSAGQRGKGEGGEAREEGKREEWMGAGQKNTLLYFSPASLPPCPAELHYPPSLGHSPVLALN